LILTASYLQATLSKLIYLRSRQLSLLPFVERKMSSSLRTMYGARA